MTDSANLGTARKGLQSGIDPLQTLTIKEPILFFLVQGEIPKKPAGLGLQGLTGGMPLHCLRVPEITTELRSKEVKLNALNLKLTG